MNYPAVGSARFMLSYLVALGAYLLLHLAINRLLRSFAQRTMAIQTATTSATHNPAHVTISPELFCLSCVSRWMKVTRR